MSKVNPVASQLSRAHGRGSVGGRAAAARGDQIGSGRGGLAWLAGAGTVTDAAWLAAACGLGYALWSAADSIRRGRIGVDVIALLELAGAVAVRELLAAAVVRSRRPHHRHQHEPR
jgi:hypothetical protein